MTNFQWIDGPQHLNLFSNHKLLACVHRVTVRTSASYWLVEGCKESFSSIAEAKEAAERMHSQGQPEESP